jgi:transposase
VAVNTVKNWVRAAATEGRRVAKPRGRGPAPRLGAPQGAALRQMGAADNDATLAEYGARLTAQTGVSVSRPGLCVTVKRLGFPRKKDPSGERAGGRRYRRRARRPLFPARGKLCRRGQGIASGDLVFVDEIGVSTKL